MPHSRAGISSWPSAATPPTVQNATRPHEYSTEFSGPLDDVADLFGAAVLPKNGAIELSDRPGLGIELNESAVARLTVR